MSNLNIAFDRYASVGTVMHYILGISYPFNADRQAYSLRHELPVVFRANRLGGLLVNERTLFLEG